MSSSKMTTRSTPRRAATISARPLLVQDRTPLAFEAADRRVRVHGNDKTIGFAGRRLKVAHVADVQQIEDAVRKRNRAASGALLRDERFDVIERDHRHDAQTPASRRMAARSSAGDTVAVPRFMTTMPPA